MWKANSIRSPSFAKEVGSLRRKLDHSIIHRVFAFTNSLVSVLEATFWAVYWQSFLVFPDLLATSRLEVILSVS